jgi:hypothetical protein
MHVIRVFINGAFFNLLCNVYQYVIRPGQMKVCIPTLSHYVDNGARLWLCPLKRQRTSTASQYVPATTANADICFSVWIGLHMSTEVCLSPHQTSLTVLDPHSSLRSSNPGPLLASNVAAYCKSGRVMTWKYWVEIGSLVLLPNSCSE